MTDPDPTTPPLHRPDFGPSAAGKAPTSLTHPLPSGEVPLETHFDVLRRFMSVSRNGAEPVEPAAVEGHGVPPRAAELNAAFLCDIGLLVEEMPGRFKPTPVAMQLINTQIADEGRGRRLLRSLIEKTWFAATARSLLQTDRATPSPEDDLLAALAKVAHLPARQGKGSLRVLMEYLAYTGIIVPPDQSRSMENARSNQPASRSSGQHPTGVETQRTRQPETPRTRETNPTPTDGEWEVIQTGEFSLKIRPNPSSVKRLRRQLDLLDQKLHESANPSSDR